MLKPMTPIEVSNLTIRNGERCLLDAISCRIDGGGITAVLGANGAGKSLFLRCLHGLEMPDSGVISFAGIRQNPAMRLAQSFVFQTPTLLRRTVAENLRFVAHNRGIDSGQIDRWLERVGLADRATQPARLLSGGEKQRLALARGLLTEPSIVFLDEATSNLDPASVQVIEDIVLEAAAAQTKIIIITHDLAQAQRLADDVVFLDKGRLLEHAPAETFFAQPQSPEAEAYLAGKPLRGAIIG